MLSLCQFPKDVLVSILYFLPMKELIEDKRVCKLFYKAIQDVENRLLQESSLYFLPIKELEDKKELKFIYLIMWRMDKSLLKKQELVSFKELYWARRIREVEREISDCQKQKALKEESMDNNVLHELADLTIQEESLKNQKVILESHQSVEKSNRRDLEKIRQNTVPLQQKPSAVVEYAKNVFYSFIGGKEAYDRLPEVGFYKVAYLNPGLLLHSIMRSKFKFHLDHLYLKNQIKAHEVEITVLIRIDATIHKQLIVLKYDPNTSTEVDRVLTEEVVPIEAYPELEKSIEKKLQAIQQKAEK